MGHVTVQNGLAYLEGKLIGVVVTQDVPNSYFMPVMGGGSIRIAVARDAEEFAQLSMYQWKANVNARKVEIQRRYNKGNNESYENVLKTMDEWMSSDADSEDTLSSLRSLLGWEEGK